MNTYYDMLESPIGTLTLISNGKELTGLYMDGGTGRRGEGAIAHADSVVKAEWIRDAGAAPFRLAKEQLYAYFAGTLKEFDIPLAAEGTLFQQCVWNELRKIPYGITISYGELAARISNPKGSRAVGLANGRNPISIIVPCHRVIGSNGKLVGYGGGLDRKIWLLELEQNSTNQLNIAY